MAAVPRMNISMTEVERARLFRLAERWEVKPARAIARAVLHTLETLDAGEPIHSVERPRKPRAPP
jgi:hypothetical protein